MLPVLTLVALDPPAARWSSLGPLRSEPGRPSPRPSRRALAAAPSMLPPPPGVLLTARSLIRGCEGGKEGGSVHGRRISQQSDTVERHHHATSIIAN